MFLFIIIIATLAFLPEKVFASSYNLDCYQVNKIVEKYYSTLRINNKFSDTDYKRIIESRKVNLPIKNLNFSSFKNGKEIYLYPPKDQNNKCVLLFVTEKDGMHNYRGLHKLTGPSNDLSTPSEVLLGFDKLIGADIIVIEQDLSLSIYNSIF